MPTTPNPSPKKKPSFFKQHILPAFFIFLIPGFSAWFFAYAENNTDREVLRDVESNVHADASISAAKKSAIVEFYRSVPVSRIMASDEPKFAKLQAMFEPVKTRYAIFRWMKRISWVCLGTIAATFVIVGLSVALSFRSHAAQYRALRIGWPVLRTSAAIQVLGQGILAVALSFWVSAILTDSYYIKLIAAVGLMAIAAAISLWKAIFSKVNNRCEVSGELVSETDAPALWARVREMAHRLNTAAPSQIIVGIAPSFFVTEHPVRLVNDVYQGRTLYLSLPMLKVLAAEEADAVFGHELAHFSGDDTLWSRKISPLSGKFGIYLQTLGAKGLSSLVAHFMFCFWKLYHLSIGKLSREREFRADRIGADLASKEAAMRALVKITCYCEFRGKTERSIIEKNRVDQRLNLALQLEQGYAAFLSSYVETDKAISEEIPHPFDSHPTLEQRLTHLGFDARAALRTTEIREVVNDSWYTAITTASTIEDRLWSELNKNIQAFHGMDLAWRLQPSSEEEAAMVEQHFPRAVFRNKKGAEATLAFDRFQLPEWSEPILFRDIAGAGLVDAWPNKQLKLQHRKAGASKPVSLKCYPGAFKNERGTDMLTEFCRYYGRHQTAEARSKEIAAVR
jgi:Zn-dependent protease with chaperone function